MNQIIELTKVSKGYRVVLEKFEMIVSFELVRKYSLKVGMNLDLKTLNQIKDEQMYHEAYALGLVKLKRMLTKKEVNDYLIDQGFKPAIIKRIIFEYEKKHYVDDELYAKLYIQSKIASSGPLRLREKLIEKGISFDLIERYLNTYDEDQVLFPLIEKKIKTYKKESRMQIILKTRLHFVNKGFHLETIDRILAKMKIDESIDDVRILKEIERLYPRLRERYRGYELKQRLIDRLRSKGYAYQQIQQALNQFPIEQND